MTSMLCIYVPHGDGWRCRMCGDTTNVENLKRVCPTLRNPLIQKTWSYGVTTVQERFISGLLDRTLASLAAAGFDEPRLFVDGVRDIPALSVKYETTYRYPKLRTFGNWMLTLWELYVREPHADFYAIFQDDCIAVKSLRAYIERVVLPDHGYLNLYTFPENEKDEKGFYLSNQRGKGAVGIVIPAAGIVPLLSSEHMALRPLDFLRGHRNVDGGVVTAFAKAGWREYVHNPSLLQHMGDESSMGNRRFEKASTFPGEFFDALTLLDPELQGASIVRSDNRPRIGLFGYCDDSIEGRMAHQVAHYCKTATVWLHRVQEGHKPLAVPDHVETMPCDIGNPRKILQAMTRCEVVLFVGHPSYKMLIELAVQEKKRVVCIAREGMHENEWMESVSLFVCTEDDTYKRLHKRWPCAMFPWPADLDIGAQIDYNDGGETSRWQDRIEEFETLVRHGDHNRIALPFTPRSSLEERPWNPSVGVESATAKT